MLGRLKVGAAEINPSRTRTVSWSSQPRLPLDLLSKDAFSCNNGVTENYTWRSRLVLRAVVISLLFLSQFWMKVLQCRQCRLRTTLLTRRKFLGSEPARRMRNAREQRNQMRWSGRF
jgi:hypothetical protein